MHTTVRVHRSLFVCGLAFVACAGWAAQAGTKLLINGQVASTDIRTIDGRAYVPLADVARALHMTLVNKPGSIELTPEGGANQVEGTHGKIGESIFTGKWRFQVNSVQQMNEYTEKYTGRSEKITPKSAADTLVVVDCRIKNGLKAKQELILTVNADGRTALTDDQEHSFEPYRFDAHNETGAYGGPVLLPGAAGEFALIFSVPQGATLKDLVFTILSGPADPVKGADLRISLQH